MKAILIASIYIILGNHIARSYRQRFALHLLPHNFAVGVSNGQDFVIKTTQLAIDKFITGPQSDGRLPTRAVVFTDMTNMFNLISREELRDCLRSHFPELIQVADLFYQESGNVHFRHRVSTQPHPWGLQPPTVSIRRLRC